MLKDLVASLLEPEGIIIIASFKDDELNKTYLDRLYTRNDRAVVFSNTNGKIQETLFSSSPRKVSVHSKDDVSRVIMDVMNSIPNGYVYWDPLGISITECRNFTNTGGGKGWLKWVVILVILAIIGYFLYIKFRVVEE